MTSDILFFSSSRLFVTVVIVFQMQYTTWCPELDKIFWVQTYHCRIREQWLPLILMLYSCWCKWRLCFLFLSVEPLCCVITVLTHFVLLQTWCPLSVAIYLTVVFFLQTKYFACIYNHLTDFCPALPETWYYYKWYPSTFIIIHNLIFLFLIQVIYEYVK